MSRNEFESALKQVCAERGLEANVVLDALKVALIAAYRKDHVGENEDYTAAVDPETGEAMIFKESKDVTPPGFGRIAAQTAKQVILQKIREAEKTAIIGEFEKKVGTIISGLVQRFEGQNVIVDLGKTSGVMPPQEKVDTEKYRLNQRVKVIIKKIKEGKRGPEIIVSRADKELVEKLFEIEVPEIRSGAVEIAAIAREPGSRSKVAVKSNQEGVDPIGSCVGQKGVRVQAVTRELFDEKIDLVNYSENMEKFIVASLSPARVNDIAINSKKNKATVYVAEDQLSLAIGKEGQNARLAAKLTGWKIDIKQLRESGEAVDVDIPGQESSEGANEAVSDLADSGLSNRVVGILTKVGITKFAQLQEVEKKELQKIKGLGAKALEEIAEVVSNSKS